MTSAQHARLYARLIARLEQVDDAAYYARYVAEPAWIHSQDDDPVCRDDSYRSLAESHRDLWNALRFALVTARDLEERAEIRALERIRSDYLYYSPRPEVAPTDCQIWAYLLWQDCTPSELLELAASYRNDAQSYLECIADPAPLCHYPDRLETLGDLAAHSLERALTLEAMAAYSNKGDYA